MRHGLSGTCLYELQCYIASIFVWESNVHRGCSRRRQATADALDDIWRSVATASVLDMRRPVVTADALVDVRLRLALTSESGYDWSSRRCQVTVGGFAGYDWRSRRRPATADALDDIQYSVATVSALDIRRPVATADALGDVRLRLAHSSTSGYVGCYRRH
jgi:hypothetical protein